MWREGLGWDLDGKEDDGSVGGYWVGRLVRGLGVKERNVVFG